MLQPPSDKYRGELLIAGFSESLGPQHWHIQTKLRDEADGPDDIPPFNLHRIEGSLFNGINGPATDWNVNGSVRKPGMHENLPNYFRTVGVEIMQRAREQKSTSPWWSGWAHVVGGQIDMTVVSASGVTVETIHRWDDKIGELIDPFRDRKTVVRFPPPLSGANRQQRRAAARAARKSGAA